MTRRQGEIGLFITAIMWGGGFIGARWALDGGYSSLQITTYRFVFSALLLYIIFKKRIDATINRTVVKNGVILGFLQFMAFFLQTEGLKFTTGAKNAFITATNVAMVPIFAWLIYKKPLSIKTITCSILALVGIGILSLEKDLSFNYGDFLTFLSAIGFALQILFTNKYSRMSDVITLTFIQFLLASIFSFIVMVVVEPIGISARPIGYVGLAYLVIFSTLAGFLLMTYCSRVVSGTSVALILSTESVFGTLFSWVILGEEITLKILIGSSIIFLAIILSELPIKLAKKQVEG